MSELCITGRWPRARLAQDNCPARQAVPPGSSHRNRASVTRRVVITLQCSRDLLSLSTSLPRSVLWLDSLRSRVACLPLPIIC
jgi:hypothetical protein